MFFIEFFTSMSHISNVYTYIYENLVPRDLEDLLNQHCVIFCPEITTSRTLETTLIRGKFLSQDNVWWNDHTGLFDKYSERIAYADTECFKKKKICQHYAGLERFFLEAAQVHKVFIY